MCLFISCTQQDNESDISVFGENNLPEEQDTNFIGSSEIENIANDIFVTEKTIFSKDGMKKNIVDIEPIGTNEEKPSYYIINYEDGGFLIMSGDKRALPVLAFSDENNFDLDAESFPGLLIDWLESQDSYIKKIREETTNDSIISVPEEEWNIENIENFIASKANNKNASVLGKTNCSSATLDFQYGPLLSTNWGQGAGYNNSAPDYGCTDYINGRTPTGCVATAMSQIMRYYEYPSSYNWSIMPNNIGSDETSRLMRDAGDSVGMNWGCSGSGAQTSNVPNALKSTFGYSSANYTDFSIPYTKTELSLGYPVILRGGERVTKWLIFNVYDNGHAWVCDGIREYTVPVRIQAGRWGYITTCQNAWTYHMNWGWSGSHNGWYSSGWQVGNDSFSYEAGMVYNIRS
ncbi:C10 family peptidase [Muricauda sp. SCSIO 64092]|uniref:C10 family peptidase n=1 Tax=Allomuricauda sp. SCSIO 64092 TaxID=2908842 RepID=UPI001FF4486B|nr:C10 family peptidase [Muricauda sp. SCSIO 64092]UOY05907.1 C10 family peptidase [Muricauda sp. SCSIO 64092]